MTLFVSVLLCYLIGSIPFSFLFAKLRRGVDPRRAGTGNVGATNALLVAGKTAGLLAMAGDTAKGIAAVSLARDLGLNEWGIALSGLAAVSGHDFSPWLGFKGGKGVATTGGILIALDPVFTLLVILLWILSMAMFRYFIPSTILVLCFLPVMMWIGSWRLEYIVFAVVNALLALYTHRLDLQRFLAGNELTIAESIAKYRRE
jgi:glycerol-3-phosphate acyltransferase PlsY